MKALKVFVTFFFTLVLGYLLVVQVIQILARRASAAIASGVTVDQNGAPLGGVEMEFEASSDVILFIYRSRQRSNFPKPIKFAVRRMVAFT